MPTQPTEGHEARGFDAVVGRYDADLERGLVLTGESKGYYAAGRVAAAARLLTAHAAAPRRVLDYGCGIGDTLPLLAAAFPGAAVVGFEPSRLVDEARRRRPELHFVGPEDQANLGTFDLIYINGVLHHVPPPERPAFLARVRAALQPGGHLTLFENNPLNPGTRLVMRRIPFDRDAIPVLPWEAARLLRATRLEVEARVFLFFFPGPLKLLRPLEGSLGWLPLGGQYVVLARAAATDARP